MGIFYIETTDVGLTGKYLLFEMSATTSVTVTNASTVTQYPIEDGSQIIDHIVKNPVTISMGGIITEISSLSITEDISKEFRTGNGHEDVRKFIEELERKITDRETFSVYFSNILKPVRNCLITSFTYSKDNSIGGNSWNIQLSLQQIRFANRAQFAYKPDVNWGKLVAKKVTASNTKASCSPDQADKVAGDKTTGKDGEVVPKEASAYDLFLENYGNGKPAKLPTLNANESVVKKKSIYTHGG